MKCPVCGAELEGRPERCPECGHRFPRKRVRVCPRCGVRVAEHARECFMCGAPLDGGRGLFPSIPWADLALVGLLVALVWLWFFSPLKAPRLESVPVSSKPTSTRAGLKPTPARADLKPSPTPTPLPTPFVKPPPTPTPTPEYLIHVVKEGEGLLAIAAKYGTTVDAIVKANDLESPDVIWEGQELIIPVPLPTPTPLYGSDAITYTVKEGESLIDIAARFTVPVEVLMEANDIPEPRVLREGEVLVIPRITPSPTPAVRATPTPEEFHPRPVLVSPPNGGVYRGMETHITLVWVGVHTLKEDEWYVVRVRYKDRNAEDWQKEEHFWTKGTSWVLPSYLMPSPEVAPRLFKWDVTIVRKAAMEDGRVDLIAASPMSESRLFFWY